jgi:hypothetical protein
MTGSASNDAKELARRDNYGRSAAGPKIDIEPFWPVLGGDPISGEQLTAAQPSQSKRVIEAS